MEALFDTSVPWYPHESPKPQPEFREPSTNYAEVPSEEIETHVQTIRDKAWKIGPLPCVGSYLFAELALNKHPAYPTILNRLKSDHSSIYLEIGCGLTQDIRKLIADGAPATQLRGTDLQAGMIACGHDLFCDAETLPLAGSSGDVQGQTFVAADFLDESDGSPLRTWEGGVDVMHASMFLHCFELPAQVRACKRIAALLRPRPGSLLIGRSGGVSSAAGGARDEVKGPLENVGVVRLRHLLHDAASFREMWEQVGTETGTRWEVSAVEEGIHDAGGSYFADYEHRWIRFEVVRI